MPPLQFFTISSATSDFAALIQGIEDGDEAVIQRCILQRMDVSLPFNEKLWTPLHLACRLNNAKAVFSLLTAGADITQCTHRRRNVVHFAAQSTLPILSMILIRTTRLPNRLVRNYSVNHQPEGWHQTASLRLTSVWELLVTNGADPSVPNHTGRTPLILLGQK